MNKNKKLSATAIAIVFCVLLMIFFSMCDSSQKSSSSSEKIYTCGYCGKQMKGGYYDYFNGNYVCRSCSKKYRRD